MAATKSVTVVHNDITLTAGGGDTTSSAQNFTTEYSAMALIKITNGATGPTVPAQVQIQISADSSNWYDWGGALIGNVDNDEIYSFAVEFPIPVMYIRFVSGSNTGQNVTLRVELMEVTAVS